MKNQETGVMEEEILTETESPTQTQPPQEDKPANKLPSFDADKLKTFVASLKAPKPIVLAILFLCLIVVYTGLLLLVKKNTKTTPVAHVFEEAASTPQAKTDPEVDLERKNLENFKNALKSSQNDQNDLIIPKADLEIKF